MMIDLLPHLPALLAQVTEPTTVTTAAAAGKSIGPTIALAGAGLGGAIGVGMVGAKAAEAVGRNPGAFGQILTISIIGMALSEAIALYAFVVFFVYK